MGGHKFKVDQVGQVVTYTSWRFGVGSASSTFTVTKLLPPEGDDFQYKIKNAAEPHERVAKESQLSRAA